MNTLWIYIGSVNIIAFIFMWMDKKRAQKRAWRIPERTLWGLGLLGGAAGIWLAMKCFRHKTKHQSFTIGVPILIFIHIGICLYVYYS